MGGDKGRSSRWGDSQRSGREDSAIKEAMKAAKQAARGNSSRPAGTQQVPATPRPRPGQGGANSESGRPGGGGQGSTSSPGAAGRPRTTHQTGTPHDPGTEKQGRLDKVEDMVDRTPYDPAGESAAAMLGGAVADRAADKGQQKVQERHGDSVVGKASRKSDQALRIVDKLAQRAALLTGGLSLKASVIAKVLRVLLPILILVGGVIIALLLVIIIGFFADSDEEKIPYRESAEMSERIPYQLLHLYQSVGAKYDIPWTILAAVAKEATEHGDKSPYDAIDRNPFYGATDDGQPVELTEEEEAEALKTDYSFYPVVRPPISDGPDSAQGPMLLWPEIHTSNPQDWHQSVLAVADAIYRIQAELRAEGVTPPHNPHANPDAVDEYWEQVLDRLPAGRVLDEQQARECGAIPSGVTVAQAAASIMRCEARQAQSEVLVGIGENNTFRSLKRVDAANTLANDMVSVVFAWGGPAVDETTGFDDYVAPGCGPLEKGEQPPSYMGILPLSKQDADRLGISDRCDNTMVLTAVARAVAQNASAPEVRPQAGMTVEKYAWLTDGWYVVPAVVAGVDWDAYKKYLSGELALDDADRQGDTGLLYNPESQCSTAWWRYLFGSDITQTEGFLDEESIDAGEGAVGATRAWGLGLGADHSSVAAEAERRFQAGFDDNGNWSDRYGQIRAEVDKAYRSAKVKERCGGDIDPAVGLPIVHEQLDMLSTTDVSGFEVWVAYEKLVEQHNYEKARAAGVKRGSEPMVRRFVVDNPELRGKLTHPAAPPDISNVIPQAGWARRVIATAIGYGGLFEGDMRDPAEFTLMSMSLALVPDPHCGPQMSKQECGRDQHMKDSAAQARMVAEGWLVPLGMYAENCQHATSLVAPEMAQLWGPMCDAAMADGIKLNGGGSRTSAAQREARRRNGCSIVDLYAGDRRPNNCRVATARIGGSYHEYGMAVDVVMDEGVYDWMHSIVGCYSGRIDGPDPNATYTPLPVPMKPREYVAKNPAPCGDAYPVKRANLYGFVFAVGCYNPPNAESNILCAGSRSRQEDWHIQRGIPLSVDFGVGGFSQMYLNAASVEECHTKGKTLPLRNRSGSYDRQLVAQAVWAMFQCVTANSGMATTPPKGNTWKAGSTTYSWDPAKFGFKNFAEQAAAEAVVVSYCESVGFSHTAITSPNKWGYAGVFQMGESEMKAFGPKSGDRMDAIDNIFGAARYFVSAFYNENSRWDGWRPWAVVNTDYKGPNEHVKYPVVPRFPSTQPGYEGRQGPELPMWAVDPFTYEVPAFNGCPIGKNGGQWPQAIPLRDSVQRGSEPELSN